MSAALADALQLGVPERIQLVQDIWDSVAAVPEAIELTPGQREELDRRLDRYRRDPEVGITWDELRAKLTTRSGATNW